MSKWQFINLMTIFFQASRASELFMQPSESQSEDEDKLAVVAINIK
jgi:hypothetical protein